MIPPFLASGLLPHGIHDAGWDEVVARLGTTDGRQRLLAKALGAFERFARANCASLYLCGSFVSAKKRPSDIDVLWDPAGVDATRVEPLLLSDAQAARDLQKRRFGAEFIPTTARRSGLAFLDFFQTDKETDEPKGIVRLDLATLPRPAIPQAVHIAAGTPFTAATYSGREEVNTLDYHGYHGYHRHCPPGTFPHDYQQGETFFLLAQRYHTTVAAIQAANPTLDPYNLQPGMVICIPKSYHHRCPPGTFPYTVQQGDTFFLLAQRFNTTVAAIRAANPGVDPYNLQPGMVLCIPKSYHHRCPPGTFPYTVQQGDTFFLLAQRFNTTVAAIRAANPGVDPYNLQPGMVICIPSH